MASVCVVVLDPQVAPSDQMTWAFTNENDAEAMAGFFNKRLGQGERVAWVQVVPFARKLNKTVLQYLDDWAEVADETRIDDD